LSPAPWRLELPLRYLVSMIARAFVFEYLVLRSDGKPEATTRAGWNCLTVCPR
jgi:hypothetical protein